MFTLDRFYLRGLSCRSTLVPRGASWARMSDHLPLVAELEVQPGFDAVAWRAPLPASGAAA